MPEVAIYQDSKARGQCRSCGAAITWAETTRGTRMPFNGDIVVSRTYAMPDVQVRVVEFVDTTVTLSHFATCPDAATWRRRDARKTR